MNFKNYLVFSKYARATEGHLNADDLLEVMKNHDGSEAYYNHFDIPESGLKIEIDTGKTKLDKNKKTVPVYRYVDLETHKFKEVLSEGETVIGPTFKNAEGACRPAFNLVGFDFDDEDSPENSLKDVQAFLNYFRFEHFYVAYSGSKGFHISVPFEYFGLPADENLPKTLRNLAHELRPHFNTLDTSVYNIGRKFRALNTKHGKTGLFKTIVSGTGIDTKDIDAIKKYCETRRDTNYEVRSYDVGVNETLASVLVGAEATASYDKSKAGTALAPTKLEAYDGKICIRRLFEAEVEEGERNTTALILVTDLFKTGKSKDYSIERMTPWIERVMPEHRQQECFEMIDDVYGGKFYNHGCMEPIKAKLCSAKCSLWAKLAVDKRPTPVDAPKSAFIESEKANKLPASKFIEHWLVENNAVVTLAGNWFLNNDMKKPIIRTVIEDMIFNAGDLAPYNRYKVVPQNRITSFLNQWHENARETRMSQLREHIAYTKDNDMVEKFLNAVVSRTASDLEVAVFKHWLWLVKRKLSFLKTEREMMIVIAGVTNTGKTRAVTKVFKPLKELTDTMMLDQLNDPREDFRLSQAAIMFFDEMAVTKKVNVDALKNKITSTWINTRVFHTQTKMQGRNSTTFIGTSNNPIIDIIKDPTSARRYFEFWVSEQCQWDEINAIDYVEMWRGIDENKETTYIQDLLPELAEAQEVLRIPDSVEDWLSLEELIPGEGESHGFVVPKTAYEDYMKWMSMQKKERYALGIRQFYNRMAALNLRGRDMSKRFYKIKSAAFDPARI